MMDAPRLPQVGEHIRGVGTLIAIESPPPVPPPPPQYIFEEQSARVECRVNGRLLKEYSTYYSLYGVAKMENSAVERASEEWVLMGRPENIEFVVVREKRYIRMQPTGRGESFYHREFLDFGRLEHGAKHNVPAETEQDIWSSQRGDLRNPS